MRVTHRIVPSLAVLLVLAAFRSCLAADGRQEVDLSGTGWKLWLDTGASWKNDELFLPPVDLTKLKINSPGGGWQALDAVPAKNVTVPGTVEEYLQTTPGPEGDIVGVSWWYRSMRIPAGSSPKKVLLRFEAVRQRAEVYVNQKLVGYDMVGNAL